MLLCCDRKRRLRLLPPGESGGRRPSKGAPVSRGRLGPKEEEKEEEEEEVEVEVEEVEEVEEGR